MDRWIAIGTAEFKHKIVCTENQLKMC
jgi:hypothetical protein